MPADWTKVAARIIQREANYAVIRTEVKKNKKLDVAVIRNEIGASATSCGKSTALCTRSPPGAQQGTCNPSARAAAEALLSSELRGAQRCLWRPISGSTRSKAPTPVLVGWSRYRSRVQAGGIASAGQMDGDTCDPTASERPIQRRGSLILAASGWKLRGQ